MADVATTDGQSYLSIGKLRDMFREAQDLSQTDRGLQERDNNYYYGHQYTAEELKEYRNRKQPAIVTNMIRPAINNVVGFEIMQRGDPKCLPRNPTQQDEVKAEAATEILRYITDATCFDQDATHVAGLIFRRGAGAVEIVVNPEDPEEIQVERIMSTDFFYDPRSRREDFLDARYLGYALWMDEDDIVSQYPNHEDEIKASYEQSAGAVTQEFEDRPLDSTSWGDSRRRRVLVVTMYYKRAGQWFYARYVSGGILQQMVSPYVDDKGKPACGIEAVSGYVNEDGERQGLVRDMIGPQDETNHRRSKLLHHLNVRQVITEKGVVDNVEHARTQLNRPDGWVEANPGMKDKLEIERNIDQVQGQAELLQDSKNDIMRVSPHSSLSETTSPNASGRALLARQQTASMELSNFFDNLSAWRKRCYTAMFNRARQFWTTEKWIRVTDDADDINWIGVNTPEMIETPIGVMPQMQQVMGPEGPMLQPVLENVMSEMDVDIVLTEGGDYATIAQEQFDGLLNLAQAGVVFPQDFYIRASSLKNKKELLDAIKEPEPDPIQQQAAAIEMQQQAADVEKTQSETIKNLASADKASAEADQTELETGIESKLPTAPNLLDFQQAGQVGAANPNGR